MKSTLIKLLVAGLGLWLLNSRGEAQPVVATQPTNQIVLNRSNVVFSVAVSGTGPFTYQWQFNGINLPNDLITTVAGNGNGGFSGDGVLATASSLHYPLGVTVDNFGNLFIADNYNSRVRRVDTNGIISTVAGNGVAGYSDSGVATNVNLTDPSGVAVDSAGNIFFVDAGNEQVYKVDTSGILTALAARGTFYNPLGIAMDHSGYLYIADASNNRVVKVNQSGTISTVAGDGDSYYYGDGGPATAAGVHQPFGTAVDNIGNLFIAEASSGCIRKVDTNAVISTIVTGLNEPYGVAVDNVGNIFIANTWNNRIQKMDANGLISTIAGGGTSSADNISAANSSLSTPEGIAVDHNGNILIADTFNNRVREIEQPGPRLVLNNLSTNNAGDYCVIISNSSGSVTSSVAHLTIVLPPSIATLPQSQQVVAGTNVVFSVATGGTEPLSYQWQFNGTNMDAATNTAYVIDSATPDFAGNYSVIITNLYGCVTSSAAILTTVPLSITVQPQSQQLLAGSNVTFNVSAASTQPLAYQWFFNGSVIGGAFGSSYSINPLTTDLSGNYSVVLTNLYGTVTSSVAVLTVVVIDITNQPRSQSILAGSNVTFSVSGNVLTPVNYQWQFNGTNIAGATNASYSIAPVIPANAGNYTVILTNVYGVSTSSLALLTVLVLPPSITTQPSAQEVPAGSTVIFSVTASGTAPLNYQWLWSGAPLDNQTNSLLSLPNVSPSQVGAYSVVITNAYGSITSRVVPLVVGYPPTITLQPTNQSVLVGNRALLTAGVSGVGPLTFQWQLNGTNLPNNLITTIAGNGIAGFAGDGGIATTGKIGVAYAVAADGAGNVFIADAGTRTPYTTNYRIRKVDTNGVMTTIAGTGLPSFSGDGGPASNARIREADGLAVDGAANLYISDSGNNRIRKVDTNGIITTVVGGGVSGDGVAATSASLSFPCGIALDGNGNLFIADSGNQRIRRVDTNGIITTVAGKSSAGFSGDGGAATNATLNYPQSVAVDGVGNLFIADSGNQRIRRVDTNGIITTVAGNGSSSFSGDGGLATNASISSPYGVAVDGYGDLIVADTGHNRIRQVDSYGIITTVAGTNTSGYMGDGVAATNAPLYFPTGVTMDSYGRILFADTFDFRMRRFGQGATLVLDKLSAANAGNYTLVVNSSLGSVTSAVATLTVLLPPTITTQPASQSMGLGSNATFNVSVTGTQPLSCLWQINGVSQSAQTNQSLSLTNVQWSDAGSYQVVITNNFGSITSSVATMTVGVPPFIVSQPSNQIVLVGSNSVLSMQVAGDGLFTYQWQFNGTNLPPIITTVAGTNVSGFFGDGGLATIAKFNAPQRLDMDAAGNLLIDDSGNNRVRRVGTNGIITTIAGTGTAGYSGNGGLATNAKIYANGGLGADGSGNFFIAEFNGGRVCKVDTNDTITLVAGGGSSYGENISATSAAINDAQAVAVDKTGNLFIADYYFYRIRKVGTNGLMTTVAGNPTATGIGGFSGDGGWATNATMGTPTDVAVDSLGNVYIADSANSRIRKVDTNGIINTVIGGGASSADGLQGTNTYLPSPVAVVVDSYNNLYVTSNGRVRKMDTNGVMTTVAGGGNNDLGDYGPATSARFWSPVGLTFDAQGNMYVAEQSRPRIRKVHFGGDSTLTLVNANITNSGNYSVLVTSAFGSVASSNFTLTVAVQPIISAFTASNGAFNFLWGAQSNLTYQLQCATNLMAPVWQNVGSPIVATNSSVLTTDIPGTDTQRFYRVRLLP
jgi:sugar lactone lactonase YvrE